MRRESSHRYPDSADGVQAPCLRCGAYLPVRIALARERSESDLTQFSIEDLMEQKVTSVSRTEQAFSDTATATFVMTQEDLRRSGVTSIAEALRMVPGCTWPGSTPTSGRFLPAGSTVASQTNCWC